jgi:ParB family chromosome partitioning protein
LASSIKELGVIQPITVRKLGFNKYQLVSGERRYRASKLIGLKTIPSYIRIANDQESLEMALVENIQREELTPIEEALAYRQLMDEFHLTQEDIAKRVGKSRPVVANLLRVLNLPEEIKEDVDHGNLSVGHARSLLALETSEKQVDIARQVIRQGLSVSETETLVARSLEAVPSMPVETESATPQNEEKRASRLDIYLSAIEEELMHDLGTKVRLHPRKKGGKIEIEYYSNEELDGIISRLRNQNDKSIG